MNKRKLGLVVVLVVTLSLCGLSYGYTMLPHDRKLNDYKKAFVEIHHPERTRFVTQYKFLGVLDHQRTMYKETYTQGCDYIFGEIREYTNTKESIEAFYAKQTIVVEQQKEGISVRFIPLDEHGHIDRDGWIKYGPRGIILLEDIAASLFTVLDPSKSYYFVFVSILESSESETDFRCLLG